MSTTVSTSTGEETTRVAYVLDDEAQIATFVCKVLEANGYQAQAFLTPIELFVESRKALPDLIVLDLALGQSDAVEVIRYLDTMKFRGYEVWPLSHARFNRVCNGTRELFGAGILRCDKTARLPRKALAFTLRHIGNRLATTVRRGNDNGQLAFSRGD